MTQKTKSSLDKCAGSWSNDQDMNGHQFLYLSHGLSKKGLSFNWTIT